MRKARIKHSDFSRIFPEREFGIIDRYMQSIWLVDFGDRYEIQQRVSLLCVFLSLFFYIFVTPLVLFLKGFFGAIDMCKCFAPYALGKPIRKDDCYHDSEKTNELIKVAGW